MIFKIFTPSLMFDGILDDFASAEYTECFDGSGEFSCTVPADAHHYEMLTPDSLVYASDGNAFVIVERTVRDGLLLIKGEGILSFFDRRVQRRWIAHRGTPESLMLDIAAAESGSLPGPLTSKNSGGGASVSYEQDYTSAVKALQEIASVYGIGMKLAFLPEEAGFSFQVLYPRNRSVLSCEAGLVPVYLSRRFENITEECFEEITQDYKNSAYVYGSVIGGTRYYAIAGDDSALDKRELFVDASTKSIDSFSSGGSYDTAAYMRFLKQYGEYMLSKHNCRKKCTAVLNPANMPDLSVGDICTMQSDVLPIRVDGLVTEICHSIHRGIYEKKIILTA